MPIPRYLVWLCLLGKKLGNLGTHFRFRDHCLSERCSPSASAAIQMSWRFGSIIPRGLDCTISVIFAKGRAEQSKYRDRKKTGPDNSPKWSEMRMSCRPDTSLTLKSADQLRRRGRLALLLLRETLASKQLLVFQCCQIWRKSRAPINLSLYFENHW